MRFQLLYNAAFVCSLQFFVNRSLRLLFYSNRFFSMPFLLSTSSAMHKSPLIFIIVFVSRFKTYFTFQIMRCGHIKCHACFMRVHCFVELFSAKLNEPTTDLTLFFASRFPKRKAHERNAECTRKVCDHQQANKERYMQFSNVHSSGPDVERHILEDSFMFMHTIDPHSSWAQIFNNCNYFN